MTGLKRRTLVAAASGVAAVVAAPRLAAGAGRVFRHGVASGDPVPRGVVLWTRVTPTEAAQPGSGLGPAVEVRWEVASDPRFRRVVARGVAVTTRHQDHTVHVDVRHLRPATTYWYRFRALGQVTPVGRARTAPAASANTPVRFGVVSCANYGWGFFAGYRHLSQRSDLDAVLHLGDYIYEYGPDGPLVPGIQPATVRVAEPRKECLTLADYRERHGCYRLDADLQAMHAAHSVIAVWDDHEIANDTWREGAENHSPDEGPWAERASAGRRAWREWLPVRRTGHDDPMRIQRRLRYGRHVDLWMLDERRFRDEQASSVMFSFGSADPAINDPSRTMLGAPQRDWLTSGLRGSTATWKVLGNQVPFFPLAMGPGVTSALEDALAPVTAGAPKPALAATVDGWDGYASERARLTDQFAEIDDVVILTGDVHESFASEIPLHTGDYRLDGRTAAVEFICPGISSPSLQSSASSVMPGSGLVIGGILEANLAANNPWVKYHEADHTGYGIVDFTPQRVRYDFWQLTDGRNRDSGINLAASWQSIRGSGRVSPASGQL
jgi:alkaline phosphatase D